jgi:hypothetical protein
MHDEGLAGTADPQDYRAASAVQWGRVHVRVQLEVAGRLLQAYRRCRTDRLGVGVLAPQSRFPAGLPERIAIGS